ncbi:MAG: LPS export ABC transporter permease LptG [Candidatus Symbiobacter sp.]|nr:LPS export ABC transporter permease LptG [Candidatus Symbiobacter sp.]
MSWTLSSYIGRRFLAWVGIILFAVTMLVGLANLLELLRKNAGNSNNSMTNLLAVVLYRLPFDLQYYLHFVVLFATIVCFWQLSRTSELIVARAVGVSARQFLMPVIILGILLAAVKILIWSPISAATYVRYQRLLAVVQGGVTTEFDLVANNLWLREKLNHNNFSGSYILHARSTGTDFAHLGRVSVMLFDEDGALVSRYDADQVVLLAGRWALSKVSQTLLGELPVPVADLTLPTEFTPRKIELSLSQPETLSFYALPRYIKLTEDAGFSALRQRLAYYQYWVTPALLMAMILLGASFALRITVRGGIGFLVAAGILAGFLFHFITDIVSAMGMAARIPTWLAVTATPVMVLLLAISLLLHYEDG